MMERVAPAELELGFNRRLRRHSEHLPRLDIPNDNHNNPFFQNVLALKSVTEEETREEGKVLFGTFIAEEISKEDNLDTPEEIRQELDHLW